MYAIRAMTTADSESTSRHEPSGSPDRATGDVEPRPGRPEAQSKKGEGDFGDLLQELRVLLQGVQVLTGFLIILPFNEGFARVSPDERRVYFVLFLCALLSLILFSAPAAQHRLRSPLPDRVDFKRSSTRTVVIGMIPLSAALVLATHFVIDQVGGRTAANYVSAFVAVVILLLWWVVPLMQRRRERHHYERYENGSSYESSGSDRGSESSSSNRG